MWGLNIRGCLKMKCCTQWPINILPVLLSQSKMYAPFSLWGMRKCVGLSTSSGINRLTWVQRTVTTGHARAFVHTRSARDDKRHLCQVKGRMQMCAASSDPELSSATSAGTLAIGRVPQPHQPPGMPPLSAKGERRRGLPNAVG